MWFRDDVPSGLPVLFVFSRRLGSFILRVCLSSSCYAVWVVSVIDDDAMLVAPVIDIVLLISVVSFGLVLFIIVFRCPALCMSSLVGGGLFAGRLFLPWEFALKPFGCWSGDFVRLLIL